VGDGRCIIPGMGPIFNLTAAYIPATPKYSLEKLQWGWGDVVYSLERYTKKEKSTQGTRTLDTSSMERPQVVFIE
jgi:hypothetical protein